MVYPQSHLWENRCAQHLFRWIFELRKKVTKSRVRVHPRSTERLPPEEGCKTAFKKARCSQSIMWVHNSRDFLVDFLFSIYILSRLIYPVSAIYTCNLSPYVFTLDFTAFLFSMCCCFHRFVIYASMLMKSDVHHSFDLHDPILKGLALPCWVYNRSCHGKRSFLPSLMTIHMLFSSSERIGNTIEHYANDLLSHFVISLSV